jgi:hypothetical protein
MEHRWNDIDRGKPVPVPLCPQQIPHGLTRDRTRVSAVGGYWNSEARRQVGDTIGVVIMYRQIRYGTLSSGM